MAILISAHKLTKIFSSRTLFDKLTFSIGSGERIGLIGPNGAGKSTLLKILANKTDVDDGTLSIQRGLKVGFLEQVPEFSEGATVHSSVMEGAEDPYDWEEISRADEVMSKLSLTEGEVNPDTLIENLSGGWKKRVALARELIKQPDLLLLDEPTNHLDIESILWLENLLEKSNFATITITHDRLFLQKVSNKIFELDRRHPDGLLKIDGDYAKYLEVRSDLLSAQEQHETKLKNTLRRETEWLRRGPQARLKKQQARIDQAGELKTQVEDLTSRNQVQRISVELQTLEKNPKKLIEAKNISKAYGENIVVPPLDLLLTPKSRIGLIGPNGCGKSTLIKLLTQKEKTDTGSVFHADKLEVAYFEQNRESLNQELSVYKTVCQSGDFVAYGDSMLHAKSYLNRFLFTYEQMDMPVCKLSGGEQSRLLLAKLLLRKCNVLILDEPTNDLDISTLDVLQEILSEFNGAIILVTHDRFFLDQVSNLLLAFGIDEKGKKTLTPMVGLDQWEIWYEDQAKLRAKLKSNAGKTSPQNTNKSKKKKLSFNDQFELDHMDENIKKAETLLAQLTEESTHPENISNSKKIIEISEKMAKTQKEIDRLYAKWEELTSD